MADGIGASGNSNVAATVNQTQYSIGYVELAYALTKRHARCSTSKPSRKLYSALTCLHNRSRRISSNSGLPSGSDSWENVNILNTQGAQAYPIVTPTYILLYKELNVIPGMDMNKATQLVQYLWYVVHDGQQLGTST